MNSISPKSRFLSDRALASQHSEMVVHPGFRAAAEAALLNYAIKLDGHDVRSALKIQGAKEVLQELLNLGDPSKPLMQSTTEELNPV